MCPLLVALLCLGTAGLKHIHAQGLVHLDCKPENIFLTGEGSLKLGDLGASFHFHCHALVVSACAHSEQCTRACAALTQSLPLSLTPSPFPSASALLC
jgi:serine/threonine protein kinase